MTAPVPTQPTTATPSLQRRVTIIVVGLLTLLMVILGVVIDVSLDVQARRNLHDRLVAATSRADALVAAHTTPSQIAAELNGGSIRALLITSQGATYGDPAIRPDTTAGPATPLLPPPPPPPPRGGPRGWGRPPPPWGPPPPPGGPPPPPQAPPPPSLGPASTSPTVGPTAPTAWRPTATSAARWPTATGCHRHRPGAPATRWGTNHPGG
jgi:two-component system OmpR family sensor kinase